MSHIFISYSKHNTIYARELADHLLREGFDVWIDDRIDYGEDWWGTIVQAIRDSGAFIVIMSPESDQSRWVQREVTIADELRKPVFPLLLAGDLLSSQHWSMFVRTQYVDVRTKTLPPGTFYERLAYHAPRKSTPGEEVTGGFKPISDEVINEVSKLAQPSQMEQSPTQSSVSMPLQPDKSTKISDSSKKSRTQKPKPRSLIFYKTKEGFVAIIVFSFIVVFLFLLLIYITINSPSLNQALPTLIVSNTSSPSAIPPPVTANNQWTPIIQFFSGVEMVMVPQGCFKMGSLGGYSDETPVENICFDQPFWIDRYEVTNAQYGSSGNFAGDNLPREGITWFEAKVFCEARGARLPTEAEWEYAARGPSNFSYPWGYLFFTDYAVYSRNRNSQTAPVGSKPMGASWVGALDMSGNVWEWVSTIYDEKKFPYPYKPDDGRENMDDRTSFRVMRGGSWFDSFGFLRSANRHSNSPDQKSSLTGFRCARDYHDGDLAN
jgi:formylglycine-generating enzyme required for sulfatase activity